MIEIKGLNKSYGSFKVLKNISLSISKGSIYGLIGSNGAGKSTLLQILSGILKQNDGSILIDGGSIFENPEVKEKCFLIADDQYYFSGSCPIEMAKYYSEIYPAFDMDKYRNLIQHFGLNEKQKLSSMSKGMKRQCAIICGVASGAEYIFCDEAFDGLDPAARQAAKKILINDVAEHNHTVVISSHNMSELEQLCDNIGILHKGCLLMSSDIDAAKQSLIKLQYVCGSDAMEPEKLLGGINIIRTEKRGMLRTVIIRENINTAEDRIKKSGTAFYEKLPLTLEEVFLIEMEVNGYDPQKLGL